MCDASDSAIGAVLGQSKDKKDYAISNTRKTLTGPQLIYATTEKEFLAVVFAIEKFITYEYLFCPPLSDWLWPLARWKAQGYYQGLVPQVPWVTGCSPKFWI
jgi:hypothetical protein